MYVEERGKLNMMKEFDERTIWTSDRVPLMASYNKGFSYFLPLIDSSLPTSLKIYSRDGGREEK